MVRQLSCTVVTFLLIRPQLDRSAASSLLVGQSSSSSSERLYTCRTLQNQLLAQLPQAGGAALILGLGRGQTAEAVVEVHAS